MPEVREKAHRHHVLFCKSTHNIFEPAKKLRSNPSLIIPMRLEDHNALHHEVSQVPILSMHAAQKVLELYQANPECHIESVTNLIDSYSTVAKMDGLDIIEKQIATVAVNALFAQLPFIKRGLLLPSNEINLLVA